jgi:3-dehydroquinate synthase
VISDLGAYAESQFMRGIDFTLIPTSLMAMVDASIGGKAAINFNHLKNYIGGYYKPADHFIYHGFLETLPQEECHNGITEMLKHGLIADPEHYQDVVPLINDVKIPSLELIQRSQDIKHGYVLEDYHEQSVRKQLNFGHTIGHALESLAAYKQEKLSHGMAVGMGILIESEISRECMDLSDSELLRIQSDMHPYIIEFQNLELEEDLLMGFIRKDKKNDSGKILFSLLDGIGACRQDQEVEEALIIKCLKSVQEL